PASLMLLASSQHTTSLFRGALLSSPPRRSSICAARSLFIIFAQGVANAVCVPPHLLSRLVCRLRLSSGCVNSHRDRKVFGGKKFSPPKQPPDRNQNVPQRPRKAPVCGTATPARSRNFSRRRIDPRSSQAEALARTMDLHRVHLRLLAVLMPRRFNASAAVCV